MSQALAEAQKSLYLSNPNPRVGCVIVKDGQVIGRGHTQRVRGPHAEVQALADAKPMALRLRVQRFTLPWSPAITLAKRHPVSML